MPHVQYNIYLPPDESNNPSKILLFTEILLHFFLTTRSLRLLLLNGKTPHTPTQRLLHVHKRHIRQPSLQLLTTIPPIHTCILHALPCQFSFSSSQPTRQLGGSTGETCKPLRQHPDLVGVDGAAVAGPEVAACVPEVGGGVVGDDEGFAVNFLVV